MGVNFKVKSGAYYIVFYLILVLVASIIAIAAKHLFGLNPGQAWFIWVIALLWLHAHEG
jgi:hypothetical protein